MKWLKLFENNYSWNFYKEKEKFKIKLIIYTAVINNVNYIVTFTSSSHNKVYHRNFKTENFGEKKGNPFSVGKCVAEITKDFIEKYTPNAIIMQHIKDEKEPKKAMSRRAILSNRFLKNKINYNIQYFLDPEGWSFSYITNPNFKKPFKKLGSIYSACREVFL